MVAGGCSPSLARWVGSATYGYQAKQPWLGGVDARWLLPSSCQPGPQRLFCTTSWRPGSKGRWAEWPGGWPAVLSLMCRWMRLSSSSSAKPPGTRFSKSRHKELRDESRRLSRTERWLCDHSLPGGLRPGSLSRLLPILAGRPGFDRAGPGDHEGREHLAHPQRRRRTDGRQTHGHVEHAEG